jgi:hypothetical protein
MSLFVPPGAKSPRRGIPAARRITYSKTNDIDVTSRCGNSGWWLEQLRVLTREGFDMNNIPGCAFAHSPRGRGPVHAPSAICVRQRSVVIDPGRGRWDLVTLLRLRAARAGISVAFAQRPTDAEAIAAAFRAGASAYVVGCGDADLDCAFVQAECDAPPYAPAD